MSDSPPPPTVRRPSPVERARQFGTDPAFLAVAAATVVATVLGLVRLSSLPLFIDEGASWSVASQESLGDFWSLLLDQEVAPPPFYLGLRVLVEGIGADGHAAMRLPVLLLTVPAVPLSAVLARQLGSGRVGTISAAWLLALSPLLLSVAQQVRAYGPAVMLTVLAAVLLLHAQDRGFSRRTAAAAAAAFVAAPWVHYVAFLPLAVLLLASAPRLVRPVRWSFLVPVGVGWAAAAVFGAVQFDRVGAGLDGTTRLGGTDLQRVLATAWDGRYAADETLFRVALVGLVVVAAVAVLGGGRRRAIALAGLAGPAVVVAISAAGPDIVSTRYLVCAIPFVAVAVAVAADRFRPAIAVVVLLLGVGGLGVYRSLDPETGSYPNAEAVLQGVIPDLRPGFVVASEDITLANWLPTYVAERSGIPDVGTAWGTEQTGRAACARKRIRQIVPGDADRAAAVAIWEPIGYSATIKNLPTPGWLLVSAEPTGPRPPICDRLAGR